MIGRRPRVIGRGCAVIGVGAGDGRGCGARRAGCDNGAVSNTDDFPRLEGDNGEPLETDVTDDVVTVRRAPRYGRFITLGALVGAVVALILTFAFSGEPAQPELEPGFDKGQVFGFLLLLCGTIGAALGAVAALVIDRASIKRARPVDVVHESTHRIDEESGPLG